MIVSDTSVGHRCILRAIKKSIATMDIVSGSGSPNTRSFCSGKNCKLNEFSIDSRMGNLICWNVIPDSSFVFASHDVSTIGGRILAKHMEIIHHEAFGIGQ